MASLRYDGYYRSGLIESVDWHAGVRMVKTFYSFLQFFDDGFCVRKNSELQRFDFKLFLAGLDIQAIKARYPADDPKDDEYDYVYRTCRYAMAGDQVILTFQLSISSTTGPIVIKKKVPMRIGVEDRIRDGQGNVFQFVPDA